MLSRATAGGSRARWREPRTAVLLCAGGLLALCSREAAASALGSLTTSVGLLAALAGVIAIKGWPIHFAPSALSSAGGALLVAGAAWRWRATLLARMAGLAPLLPARPGAALLAPEPSRRPPVGAPLHSGEEGESLLVDLRQHFLQLQEAWDRDDGVLLERLTTPEMLAELRRESADTGERARTEIVTLRAELIALDRVGGALVASVDYSGLMREGPELGAAPFRELRMLMRSNAEAGDVWRLARHQTLL